MTAEGGRIVVRGRLVAETAIRVGATRSVDDVDLPVLRDGTGRPLLPGSSITGALRAWVTDRGTAESMVTEVFGGNEADDRASRLRVADAAVDVAPSLRTGVSIDASTGTAKRGFLLAFEVLRPGTTFPLDLELELPADGAAADRAASVLATGLRGLVGGHVRLGGMTHRGLGRVRLDEATLEIRRLSFDSPASTLQSLQGGAVIGLSELGSAIDPSASSVVFTVDWRPRGSLMSKAPDEGLGVDMLPLMELLPDGGMAAVLPGSSVKGVLRSFAQRLWTTTQSVPSADTGSDDPACPLIEMLFGAALDDRHLPAGSSPARRTRRGALAIDDCTTEGFVPAAVWGAITGATDEVDVARTIDAAGLTSKISPAMHVAIDRWTGGAVGNALYSTLELRDAPWRSLRLELDLCQLRRGLTGDAATSAARAGVALSLVLLRSLAEGLIRLGFATYRGSGGVEVQSVHLSSAAVDDKAIAALDGTYTDIGHHLSPELMAPLMAALRSELERSEEVPR